MTPIHANVRDSALRRLSRANRWLVTGSVALTAVFSEVAANAFPGRGSKASAGAARTKAAKSHTSTEALKAPSEAPRASTTPEVSPSQEAPPAEQSSPESSEPAPETHESAPSREAAPPAEQSEPVKEESAPAPEPEPAPAPVESSPPVVSGGS